MQMSDSVSDMINSEMPGVAPPAGVTPDATTSNIIGTIGNVLQQGLSVYGQLQLQNMNMDLIKQGKPPLTAAQISAMAPQLNVGLASSTQNLVMYGLMGVGAVLLLSTLMKPSRR